ncbi:17096_t:CDS:2, partial [Gigaspora margarita]
MNKELLMGLKIRDAIIEEYAENFKKQDTENKHLRKYYNFLNAKLNNIKELVEVEEKKLP